MVASPIVVNRSYPAAPPEPAAAGVRGSAARRPGIESHLERLSAAAVASSHLPAGRLELAAVEGFRPLAVEVEDDRPSGFQVLAVYLSHDLTTPLRQPPQGRRPLYDGISGSMGGVAANEPPRLTWDNLILPDRPGSFVNLHA